MRNLFKGLSPFQFAFLVARVPGTRLIPYRRSRLKVAGAVAGGGRLHFGIQWASDFPRESQLVVGRNARIEVSGRFRIYSGATLTLAPNAKLILGRGYINNHAHLVCVQSITIGDDVAIGPFVRIIDSDQHEITGAKSPSTAPVVIGNRVWIGMGVTILKGVSVGDGAIIASASTVTKSVPAGELWGGNPARFIRTAEWH